VARPLRCDGERPRRGGSGQARKRFAANALGVGHSATDAAIFGQEAPVLTSRLAARLHSHVRVHAPIVKSHATRRVRSHSSRNGSDLTLRVAGRSPAPVRGNDA
jgi:hypothetical protein